LTLPFGGEVLAETDASGNTLNEYIFFGGKRIAILPSGGNTQYYIEDLLGSSRAMTQNNGTPCYDADFDPYGGEHAYINSCSRNYKFEGKERDTETGNDDFGARYYTSRFGRWLSADWSSVPVPVPYANLANPQTLNLYSMVADDPESFANLDGHCCEDAIDLGEQIFESPTLAEKIVGGLIIAGAAVLTVATNYDAVKDAAGKVQDFVEAHPLADSQMAPVTLVSDIAHRKNAPPVTQQNQSTPANPNGEFEPSPKHGPEQKGNASPGPKDGQTALDNSVQVRATSPRRVGVDKKHGQLVVLDQTSKDKFHGHVRTWDQLS